LFWLGSKLINAEYSDVVSVVNILNEEWCVAVFKCKPKNIEKMVPDFYGFVKDLEGVESLHFLVRDRLKNCVVFSFRVLVKPRAKSVVQSKMTYKLGSLLKKQDFAVNPEANNPLSKYVAWSPKERAAESGPKKFEQFCSTLDRMSRLVLWMLENEYFSSSERVEIAHVMSWMLGCTEYGLLSKKQWEVGYYDRIEDKYYKYLEQEFLK
jgi:hypothetical protein